MQRLSLGGQTVYAMLEDLSLQWSQWRVPGILRIFQVSVMWHAVQGCLYLEELRVGCFSRIWKTPLSGDVTLMSMDVFLFWRRLWAVDASTAAGFSNLKSLDFGRHMDHEHTDRCWFQIQYFPPLFGEDSRFDVHILQMGWFNHQLIPPSALTAEASSLCRSIIMIFTLDPWRRITAAQKKMRIDSHGAIRQFSAPMQQLFAWKLYVNRLSWVKNAALKLQLGCTWLEHKPLLCGRERLKMLKSFWLGNVKWFPCRIAEWYPINKWFQWSFSVVGFF